MKKNLDRLGGLVHSQRVLLALTQAGVSPRGRLPAGAAQRHEGLARQGEDFLDRAEGRHGSHRGSCPSRDRARMFDLGYHIKHVDTIFKRVFGTA